MLSVRNVELTNYIIKQLIIRTNLKPTFATKLANKFSVAMLDNIHDIRPYRARIRISLMPQKIADVVELGTSKIKDRIESIKTLYDKGFEVHINFSPIILYNSWAEDYIQLLKDIDSYIMSQDSYYKNKLKDMLACEVIFLTHHEKLHESNLRWNKEAEKLIWNPPMQELKVNKRGSSDILRYKIQTKKTATKLFKGIVNKYLPYCRVRYAF